MGTSPDRIVSAYRRCRAEKLDHPPVAEKWDGRAAERIAEILAAPPAH
ncbi:MAG: UDP-N-acetyl glucosamine 2-epimerase [Planctomycetes bacterium]|nr:UDP-N-acetyl glucosamine 2-epimerase [Planctomycetota bacterium]